METDTNVDNTGAFFDFDKTLIRGDSQELEAKFFIKNTLFSPMYILRILGVLTAKVFYKRNLITPWRYNQIYLKTYKGRNLDWLKVKAYELYNTNIKPALYDSMITIMNEHREKGHLIGIISATSEHLLEPVMHDLKVDMFISTRIETTEAGECTGKSNGYICVGKQKSKALYEIAQKYNVDLCKSYAYSDHHVDLPFLKSVGNPVVVNPTSLLLGEANKNDWPILSLNNNSV